ncbi:hemolymph lipopolysaccharide-binding protein-like [Nomia melanderi]|uniref:hemolymph lipopolysaccharide-binding protein-like n=1 Tax=Nomia melanderi TaxID=2448451 RepID=UPI001304264A|nr:hemolymph lipopolysaccharide-binding protein-like [Nomia melanderi]
MSQRYSFAWYNCNVLIGCLILTTALSSPVIADACSAARDDYINREPFGAYKLHRHAMNWASARKVCRDECAHLAVINSGAEARMLGEMVSNMGHIRAASHEGKVFIGIHDMFAEGEWVTVLDDSISAAGFTGWSNRWWGQPDNYAGQNCGALLDDGYLDDENCGKTLAFICKRPLANVQ